MSVEKIVGSSTHTHTWMCACENQLKFNYQRVKR